MATAVAEQRKNGHILHIFRGDLHRDAYQRVNRPKRFVRASDAFGKLIEVKDHRLEINRAVDEMIDHLRYGD